jgi:hypothetical protein
MTDWRTRPPTTCRRVVSDISTLSQSSKGHTSSLNESSSDIVDTECGPVGRNDMPADNTVDVYRDVILSLDHLPGYTGQLDLDVCLSATIELKLGYGDIPTTRIVSEQTLTLTSPGSTDL